MYSIPFLLPLTNMSLTGQSWFKLTSPDGLGGVEYFQSPIALPNVFCLLLPSGGERMILEQSVRTFGYTTSFS